MIRSKISEKIRLHSPELIGIGGLCVQFKFIRDAVGIVREIAPKTPIVCGGGIINNDAEFVFDAIDADFCVMGEGEDTIVRLANAIQEGKENFSNIENIGYRIGGKAVFTKRSYNYSDLDARPFPDYEPFDMDYMLDNQYAQGQFYMWRYPRVVPRVMPIVTARSCPFKCTFCIHSRGDKYRARSIEKVLEEIKVLYDRYHFNILFIYDELFAANKTRLKEFCEGLKVGRRDHGWDFNWLFQTHANTALDQESLELAKSAGCFFFSYGVESSSPRVLASMKKQTRPEQISEAISIAEKVGIVFYGYYIFGDPAETEETAQESFDFIEKHYTHKHFHFFIGGPVWPYPGSEIFEWCTKNGRIGDKLKFYENISGLNPQPVNMTQLPDNLFYSLLARAGEFRNFEYLEPTPVEEVSVIAPMPRQPRLLASIMSLLRGKYKYTALVYLMKTILGNTQFVSLKATCQHCGGSIEYRTFLEKGHNLSVVTGCASCNRRVRLYIEKGLHLSMLDHVRFFVFKLSHNIYRMIKRFYH